jgi:hypothetical protein
MGTEYKVRAHTAAGVLVGEITDFLELAYAKKVNAPGLGTIQLPGNHAVISQLEHRSQIEIWRRNRELGLEWMPDFYGLYLDQDRAHQESETFVMRCPGLPWLLQTRYVLWYANTTDRSRFLSVPAETVMKTIVEYNCGPSATAANGRIRDGAITGLSVQTDGAGGNSVNWYCSWDNVLESLQDLARIAGGDFGLVKTGAAAWEFRWYAGQLGTDRTSGASQVTFNLGFGNMANPKYRYDRQSEKTVAVAAGQGEASTRDIVVHASSTYSASNDVEVFVDAREVEKGATAALQDKAGKKLDEDRAREEFTFDVLQTVSTAYGVHYFLGDLVNAQWRDISAVEKIVGVTVSVAAQGDNVEQIDVEMETQ